MSEKDVRMSMQAGPVLSKYFGGSYVGAKCRYMHACTFPILPPIIYKSV